MQRIKDSKNCLLNRAICKYTQLTILLSGKKQILLITKLVFLITKLHFFITKLHFFITKLLFLITKVGFVDFAQFSFKLSLYLLNLLLYHLNLLLYLLNLLLDLGDFICYGCHFFYILGFQYSVRSSCLCVLRSAEKPARSISVHYRFPRDYCTESHYSIRFNLRVNNPVIRSVFHPDISLGSHGIKLKRNS